MRIKITTSNYFHNLSKRLPRDLRIQEEEINDTLPNSHQLKICYNRLNPLLQQCIDPLLASFPPSSKELFIEFLSGYSCLVGTLKLELFFSLNIFSSSKSFSRFFLSAAALYLLDFFTKSIPFSVRRNSVDP